MTERVGSHDSVKPDRIDEVHDGRRKMNAPVPPAQDGENGGRDVYEREYPAIQELNDESRGRDQGEGMAGVGP